MEVLIGVVVLSVGLVFVLRSLLGLIAAFYYSADVLEVRQLLSRQVWEFRDEMMVKKRIPVTYQTLTLIGARRTYRYEMDARLSKLSSKLYDVEGKMTWVDGGKIKTASRKLRVLVPRSEN